MFTHGAEGVIVLEAADEFKGPPVQSEEGLDVQVRALACLNFGEYTTVPIVRLWPDLNGNLLNEPRLNEKELLEWISIPYWPKKSESA